MAGSCLRYSCAQPLAEKKGSLDSLFAKQVSKQQQAKPESSPPRAGPSASSSSSSFSSGGSSKPKLEKRDREAEDAQAMNPDEDEDKKKLLKVEEQVQADSNGAATESGVAAGGRVRSSGERKRARGSAERKQEPERHGKAIEGVVEVIDLLSDDSTGASEDDGGGGSDSGDAPCASRGRPPVRKRQKKHSGVGRRERCSRTTARTEETSGIAAADDRKGEVEGTPETQHRHRHTDRHGNAELTEFFKVEE